MMRILLLTSAFGCAILTFVSAAEQASGPSIAKAIPYHCPVVGLPEAKSCCCPGGYCPRTPSKHVTVEYKGAKLQLCGSCCIKPFQATPEKFAVAANHQLVATNQAKQVKCPICAGKADPAATLEVAGIRVAFCSEDCCAKVTEGKLAERANRVFSNDAFSRGFVLVAPKAK